MIWIFFPPETDSWDAATSETVFRVVKGSGLSEKLVSGMIL